ncbi:MAG: futalosine hydrolase [Sphingobacteriales bacterium]|nr:MAG: futalosine hydrolase [Sphingobacteriales bacterium]
MTEFCRMELLVVAATEMEIAPFINQNTDTDVLITGVGVPAAMYHIQKKIQQKQYDCVLQAGIAGCFTNEIALGETVLIEKDCFADLGIFENNQLYSLFDTGFAKENEPPYTNGWLVNKHSLIDKFSLPKCAAITINTVTENTKVINEYASKYNPVLESMEGAALHFICLMENIPFLQLRAVSNRVGERDKTKWDIKVAVHNLNNHLLEIVQVLKQYS